MCIFKSQLAHGFFLVVNVQDTFEGDFVEIQLVTHVVVGGDSFGVVVEHDRAVVHVPQLLDTLHSTPVELDTGAYSVHSTAQHHHVVYGSAWKNEFALISLILLNDLFLL